MRVLVFQDLCVVPMMLIVPILAGVGQGAVLMRGAVEDPTPPPEPAATAI